MKRSTLVKNIAQKRSFLCVGLDPDPERIPDQFSKDAAGVLQFNKAIIDATRDYCVAYKPNTAFYEALGAEGWDALAQTINYIGKDHFIIADAKRGDIGNTSARYAKAFFEQLKADALTVAPYMGSDSVQPFLGFENKWVILLALTSNKGSEDFQQLLLNNTESPLYETVLKKSSEWASTESIMYVVGATHPDSFKRIRALVPDHFLLVPGVGAQGGKLAAICQHGFNRDCGLLVNSSRGIIYASSGPDFAEAAQAEAKRLQEEMEGLLEKFKM